MISSGAENRYRFVRQMVAGDPCPCCHGRQRVEKIFVSRADHPDGPLSGAMTTFLPADLRRFVAEAAEYLNLEVRSRWP